jgi:hypothetical protein
MHTTPALKIEDSNHPTKPLLWSGYGLDFYQYVGGSQTDEQLLRKHLEANRLRSISALAPDLLSRDGTISEKAII